MRAAIVALLGLTGCIRGEVVRVIDGVEVRGRFISDTAYGTYTYGAELEARGQYAEALAAYQVAASRDPDNVEAWVRVGAMFCLLKRFDDAEDALDEAEDVDADYEPLWSARAECWERQGNWDAALTAAARAVELDPERDETVLLHARILSRRGRHQEALRWLRAVALRSPSSLEVWRALADAARRARNDTWYRYALGQMETLRERFGQPAKGDAWAAVDAALANRELALARRRLRHARVDGRLLAARAIAVGRPELALTEAELRLGAEPENSDARVAVALSAELLGQRDRAVAALSDLPPAPEPLSPVGRALLAELVMRQGGPQAVDGWPAESARAGSAEADLLARLRERLGKREAKP
ncbi:MAG TPA: tetratricopeptide repeat protein [Polyangiaceae bacterium]|jgi:tetratricopeptide (TPR) repeat protein|nr:tetratricopeptide repeat protein [Polyangiaceae bacterium]